MKWPSQNLHYKSTRLPLKAIAMIEKLRAKFIQTETNAAAKSDMIMARYFFYTLTPFSKTIPETISQNAWWE